MTGSRGSERPTHYLICSTPRSGSSLLCSALWQTGVAGHPDDYFKPEHMDSVDWAGDAAEYCGRLFELGATPTGICGVKTMWLDLEDLAAHVRARTRERSLGPMEVTRYFPPLRHIWTTRRDKVRQAISLAKAKQTEIWNVRAGKRPAYPELRFDAGQIETHLVEIETWEEAWWRYFRSRGIEPLCVCYEDFVSDYEATVRRVLAFLGVPRPDTIEVPPPPLERLADATSEEWFDRYAAWSPRFPALLRFRARLRLALRSTARRFGLVG